MAFDRAVATLICQRLAEGESLCAICKDDGLPAESTVRAWALDDVQGFAAEYARAREIGYERLAEEILEIADTQSVGQTRTTKPDGGEEIKEADMLEHRRLRIDTRKWMLSKMLPKRYGDKHLEAQERPPSEDGGAPDLTELARGLAFLLTRAAIAKAKEPA